MGQLEELELSDTFCPLTEGSDLGLKVFKNMVLELTNLKKLCLDLPQLRNVNSGGDEPVM